jgi:hypothetical protein
MTRSTSWSPPIATHRCVGPALPSHEEAQVRARILMGALLSVVGIAATAGRATPRPSPQPVGGSRATEARRIQAHFDSVLIELEGNAVAGLSSQQRARRASLLETLRAYRNAGGFPHNYDFPGQLVPYLVDRQTGALCAVAVL